MEPGEETLVVTRFRLKSIALGALALLLLAAAQRGIVRGQITDPDGQPLEGVQVTLELADGGGGRTNATTGDDGRFTRPGVRLGNYRVSFELEGYEPLQVFVTVGSAPARINQTMIPLPEGVLSQKQAAEADFHLQEAQTAFTNGDYAKAAEGFRAFIELAPDQGAAWFNLASAYEQNGDMLEAIDAYEKAAELDPAMRQGLLSVAAMYGGIREWEQAMATYDRVMDLIENNAVILFNYAVFASNSENDAVASEFFGKAIEADPDFAVAWYQLGMLKMRLEDHEGAKAAFERFLELDPDSPQAVAAQELLDQIRSDGGVC